MFGLERGNGNSSDSPLYVRPDLRIDVPGDIALRAHANRDDLRLAIAVQFYADNRIDHADACRLSELSPRAFNRELAGRSIGIHQYPSTESPDARRAAS
jgi:predicted HTH domain antitoxin